MDGKEKLISVIRKVIKRERQEEIQIGEMVSDSTIKIKDLEIDKTQLYFIETCTVDINIKLGIVGTNAVGGAGNAAHTHGWSFQDTSTYIKKLKAGDKVAVYRINKGNFIVLGKLVSL